MKPNKLLRAAALSATAMAGLAGCRGPDAETAASVDSEVIAETPKEAPSQEQAKEEVVPTRATTTVAEPMPTECGCTAGNSKRPRYEKSAECCETNVR